jgi:hypothetical protein
LVIETAGLTQKLGPFGLSITAARRLDVPFRA